MVHRGSGDRILAVAKPAGSHCTGARLGVRLSEVVGDVLARPRPVPPGVRRQLAGAADPVVSPCRAADAWLRRSPAAARTCCGGGQGRVLTEVAAVGQQEVRWHVAQSAAGLTLTPPSAARAITILRGFLDDDRPTRPDLRSSRTVMPSSPRTMSIDASLRFRRWDGALTRRPRRTREHTHLLDAASLASIATADPGTLNRYRATPAYCTRGWMSRRAHRLPRWSIPASAGHGLTDAAVA